MNRLQRGWPGHSPAWRTIRPAEQCELASKALAVMAIFALVISTAWTNITLGFFVLCWIAAGGYREKFRRVQVNPVALWALALFGLFLVGVLYSSANFDEALDSLKKYRKLLLIPLLATTFYEPQWQMRGIHAFLAAMVLVLILSYMKLLGLWLDASDTPDYSVFKIYIAQSILMAYAVYLMAHRFADYPRQQWGWGILALLGAFHVLFMLPGRTGYVVLFALLILFVHQRRGWRGLVASLAVLIVMAVMAYQTSTFFEHRIDMTISDIKAHLNDEKDYLKDYLNNELSPDSTIGIRLEFYANTIALIRQHLLFGGGTGSFAPEYQQRAQQYEILETSNPHNEYLLITAQLGLLGLALLLLLGYSQWRLSYRLTPRLRVAGQGLILTIAVGSLFNSLLLDFTEGHFYACLSGLIYASLSSVGARTDDKQAADTQLRCTT